MEQRREPRFEADQPVTVRVLKTPERQQVARVVNASGRGLALEITSPVEPGTALQIELEDALVLGEAVYCRNGKAPYLIGVELDQVLCGLSELSRKLQEFADQDLSGRQVTYALNNGNGKSQQQAPKK
jgi:hypothetical protein